MGLDDPGRAERLLRNLARRIELENPGVSKSILEGLDEILTAIRLGLPLGLRRLLGSTNIIESMNAVIWQICQNVERWRVAKRALRWTTAGMLEDNKGFRRLKAHKQLPVLNVALLQRRKPGSTGVDQTSEAACP